MFKCLATTYGVIVPVSNWIATVYSGFPTVRIWYGQSVYWKVCPCPVRTKPETAKCPHIPQKTCCPYQLSLFFVSKTIIFVKSIRKLKKIIKYLKKLHETYFKILLSALILLIQKKNWDPRFSIELKLSYCFFII
jgi:hypothetical protein